MVTQQAAITVEGLQILVVPPFDIERTGQSKASSCKCSVKVIDFF